MRKFMNTLNFLATSLKVWADAYLLAFASVAGLKLVSFDRGLRLRGIDVLIL
jgi:hypothetical protein